MVRLDRQQATRLILNNPPPLADRSEPPDPNQHGTAKTRTRAHTTNTWSGTADPEDGDRSPQKTQRHEVAASPASGKSFNPQTKNAELPPLSKPRRRGDVQTADPSANTEKSRIPTL